MKYKDLFAATVFVTSFLLAIAFCMGMYTPLACLAGGLSLMGFGFWLVQGKIRKGYLYSISLLIIACSQWYFKVPYIYYLVTASISVLFAVLQTIEYIFKNKPLFSK